MKMKRIAGVMCAMALTAQLWGGGGLAAAASAPDDRLLTFDQTPSFFTTWWWQGDMIWQEIQRSGYRQAVSWDTLNDELLFGEKGLCEQLSETWPEDIRRNLIFELDWGWDIPHTHGQVSDVNNMEEATYYRNFNGSLVLDAEKFPGYGENPAERLKTLCDKVASFGWGGTGLWVLAQEDAEHYQGDGFDEAYWRERLEWSRYAGVAYWMVDFGAYAGDVQWRRQLTDLAQEVYPGLIIQQCVNTNPLNEGEGGRVSDNYLSDAVYMASHSDVFRVYDMTDQLKIPTMLDRVAEILYAGYHDDAALLGQLCPDELPYLTAALGLCATIARYTTDKYAMDEISRMVRWQQLAPGYALSDYPVQISDDYLADDWEFQPGDTWFAGAQGKVTQRAPAMVTRGLALPTVTVEAGDKPYVVAARNPSGAISIATLERTHGRTHTAVHADVTLPVGALTGPIGIFGVYQSLTLTFDTPLTGKTIQARDLLADTLVDITDRVTVNGGSVTLPGDLIDEIGVMAASDGDLSQGAMLLQIGDPAEYAAAPAVLPRAEEWTVNNGDFERPDYDAAGAAYGGDVPTPVGWIQNGDTTANRLEKAGRDGGWALCHTAAADFETSLIYTDRSLPNGLYTATAWVKTTGVSRVDGYARIRADGMGGDAAMVDLLAQGELSQWTQVTLPEVYVTDGKLTLTLETKAGAGEAVWFDDVALTPVTLERDALVTGLAVNGQAVEGFRFDETAYTATVLRRDNDPLPVVTASARADAEVTITQPTSLPGTATVTATGGGETVTYTLALEETDRIAVSDMAWVSSTVGDKQIQRDKNLLQNPLKLMTVDGVQTFDKGVGTHAPSDIVIDLTGKGFGRFEALVGADYEAQPQEGWSATVQFEVLVDGVSAYKSAVLKPSSPAQAVEVDVNGAKTLTLRVTDGGDHIYNDMADWVNAYLILGERTVVTGDINADGLVTVSDARLALRAVVGKITLTEEQRTAADVNRDGKVTTADVRKTLRAAVGKETL